MRRFLTVGFSLIFLLLSMSGQTENGDTLSLVSNSPFLPPGFQAPGSAGQPAIPVVTSNQFEFRGVYQLGGTYYFNLYDVRERKASWLTRENADEMDLNILSFDEEENELALSIGGKSMSLSLMKTSDRVLPVQTAQTTTTTPSTQSTEPATKEPVRRRVIRPTNRSRRSNIDTPTRRRVIRPAR